MRVFIADDDEEVRAALRILLTQIQGVSLAGEVGKIQGLLDQVQVTQPDIVLLDWELPGQPTADLLAALHALSHRLKVIVLSSRPEAEQAALISRADAFVSKGDPPERLLTVLRNIHPAPGLL